MGSRPHPQGKGATLAEENRTAEGLVLRLDARQLLVAVAGRELLATLRGRLFDQLPDDQKRPVAVGDRVRLIVDEDQATVEEILPRRNRLSRQAAGEEGKEQVLVANVDQLCLVAALRRPDFHPPLVDRILAAARQSGIPAFLVLNKTDLDRQSLLETWQGVYRDAGYEVLPTCAIRGQGLDPLKERLGGRITVLAGPSGAGKSSLLNALEPGLGRRTGDTGARGVHAGHHTTASTHLLALAMGGYVVDTPGVRSFHLWGAAPRELTALFAELAPLEGGCAFADCTHIHEPGCAIREALAAGRIPPSRFASYVALLEDLRREERGR